MCECISYVEQKLFDAMDGKYKRKPIKSISLNKVIPFNFKSGELQETKVAIEYEIEREGAVRTAKEKIIASYCPFCGGKYDVGRNDEID